MALSDRELKNVIGFYVGLRKAVFVAGWAVLVVGVAAVIILAYSIGRENGGHAMAASNSSGGQEQTVPNPRPRRVVRRRVEKPLPQREDVEQTDNEENRPGVPAAPDIDIQAVPAVAGDQSVNAFAALPLDAEPMFGVQKQPKKRGWPRRFFGAIGRGLGKVFGAR